MGCYRSWFVNKIQLSVLEHCFLFTICNSLWETIKTSTGSAAIKVFCLFPVLFCSKFYTWQELLIMLPNGVTALEKDRGYFGSCKMTIYHFLWIVYLPLDFYG